MRIDEQYRLDFIHHYKIAAIWSSNNPGPAAQSEFLDGQYSVDDITERTSDDMANDCRRFIQQNEKNLYDAMVVGNGAEQCGHDFWLTRNHHGCGYLDRGMGDIGKRLTDAAHKFGEYHLIGTGKFVEKM